ncbi:MAG: acyltransferase family protein [Actinomycetaceae bacterium]|nr:acyltransferase family protein [Actinomycetaceae bacterium]
MLQKGGKYRVQALDGLRAVGCLAVLAYHLVPKNVPGGFLGVDVFFVLSGFLITALLLKEQRRNGRIALGKFWVRRIRRLFPAVATATIICTATAVIISRDLLLNIRFQFWAVLTFTYNWVKIWGGSSYFETASPELFTNMWSLAVEQQFYLLWPLVIVLIVKVPRKIQVVVPLAMGALSAGLMALYVSSNLNRAYMGSDSHAFGLMLGAALAFTFADSLQPASQHSKYAFVRGLAGLMCFVFVIISFFTVDDQAHLSYPWMMLLVCVGTVGIIQAFLAPVATAKTPMSGIVWVLETKPFVWLGERSYSIYLWHWPLLVIVRMALPFVPLWAMVGLVVLLSVVSADLSYRYVETPMRYEGIWPVAAKALGMQGFVSVPRMFTTWVFSTASLVGIAFAFVLAPTVTTSQAAVEAGAKVKTHHSAHRENAQKLKKPQKPAAPSPLKIQPVGANVTFIGDSVTLAAKPKIVEAFPGAIVDAEVSRAWPTAAGLIQNYLNSGQLGQWVVLSLATNSAVQANQIQEVLDQIGPERHLVLVTGFGPTYQWETWIKSSNGQLVAFANQNPKRVAVARWDSVISGHTEFLAGDWVHPDQEGAKVWVDTVKAALKSFPGVTEIGAK